MPSPLLLVTLHPDPNSFCMALGDAYATGAKEDGHTVLRHDLAHMNFDPDFGSASYRQKKPLEPDLLRLHDDLLATRHLVLVAPMWWGSLPAKAKGLFDRLLLPGFAFDPRQRQMGLPKPLLTGRTARLIVTSDSPGWYFRLWHGQAMRRQIEGQILRFVGIKPQGFTHFSPIETSSQTRRDGWLRQMHTMGKTGG